MAENHWQIIKRDGGGKEFGHLETLPVELAPRKAVRLALKAVAGKIVDNVDMPDGITWSNELALHVLELKATRPLPQLSGWGRKFQENVERVNEVLRPMNARLMPTAMHPWMNPER